MKWRKLKHWLPEVSGFTYAAVPTYSEGRVYFSPRDHHGRSHVYSMALNLSELSLSDLRHELAPGKPGEFDDAGRMVCYVQGNDIYYVGWNLGVTVPFRNSLGMAKGGSALYGPIKDRDRYDPVGVGACWQGLRWYTSLIGWEGWRPRYHIVNGHPHSVAISFKDYEKEWAIARPCVYSKPIDGDHAYRMWYCYRGDQYRIGYAESDFGLQWTRMDDEVGITVSESGFDDRAVCYPCVFNHGKDLFMLYNGNSYGKTGFGLAVLESLA